MKRSLDESPQQDQGRQTKKTRFSLLEEEEVQANQDNAAQPLLVDREKMKFNVHEARSIRNIRRMQGFKDHDDSLLGTVETEENTGFVQRVADDREKITVDHDGLSGGVTLLEPFTLDRERQEGKFDSEGNWLESNVLHNRQVLSEQRQRERYKRERHDIDAIMRRSGSSNREEPHRLNDDNNNDEEANRAKELQKRKKSSVFDNSRSFLGERHQKDNEGASNSDDDDHDSLSSEDEHESERDAWTESLEEQEKLSALHSVAPRHQRRVTASAAATASSTEQMSKKQQLLTVANCAEVVLRLLQEGESVRQALNRLRPKNTTEKKHSQKTKNQKEQETNNEQQQQQQLSKDFDDLNQACSKIMSLIRDYGVFEERAPHFTRLVEQYDNSEYGKWWTYKWEGKDDEVYGPFAGRVMQQWRNQGHFSQFPILVRLESIGHKPTAADSNNMGSKSEKAQRDETGDEDDDDDMFTTTTTAETELLPPYTRLEDSLSFV